MLMSDGFGEYKMVLVVRQDLGMGKGKVAAQVGKRQHRIAIPSHLSLVKSSIMGSELEFCFASILQSCLSVLFHLFQCCHAAVGLCKQLEKSNPKVMYSV